MVPGDSMDQEAKHAASKEENAADDKAKGEK